MTLNESGYHNPINNYRLCNYTQTSFPSYLGDLSFCWNGACVPNFSDNFCKKQDYESGVASYANGGKMCGMNATHKKYCNNQGQCVNDKIVFITSTTYEGNLGGVNGADAECQTRAESAGLVGIYKAWIADGSSSSAPLYSFVYGDNSVYKLVDGTIIANSWADLTDGSLQNSISKDEFGNSQTGSVWTNVKSDGSLDSSSHCDGWTSSATIIAGVGDSSRVNYEWTDDGGAWCDYGGKRLYCFQQGYSSMTESYYG